MQTKPTTEEDKREIVKAVDEQLQKLAAEKGCRSRFVLCFTHEVDENPLPEILDYIESRGAEVENLFSVLRPNFMISRELLVRVHGFIPWDGTTEG